MQLCPVGKYFKLKKYFKLNLFEYFNSFFKYFKLKNMQLCPVRGQCCGGGGWPDHLQVFQFNQRKVMSTYFVTNQSANVNIKEV